MVIICAAEYQGCSLDGFVRYVQAKVLDYVETELYRVYITDALKSIATNTSKFAGGTAPNKRFYDLIEHHEPQDTRSAAEIVEHIIKKAGIEVL